MDAERVVRIGDIVALPDSKEWEIFTAAYNMVTRHVALQSYHVTTEERLDTWLSRDDVSPFEGSGPAHALSLFRASRRRIKVIDGSDLWEDTFGPWVQYINLSKSDFGITLIHELAHLIDRYHESPRDKLSVNIMNPKFHDFFAAYAKTQSAIRLKFVRGRIRSETICKADGSYSEALVEHPFTVEIANGTRLRVEGDLLATLVKSAWDASCTQEVFARAMTALTVFEVKGSGSNEDAETKIIKQYFERLYSPYAAVLGSVLDYEDFVIIKEPLLQGLRESGWLRR